MAALIGARRASSLYRAFDKFLSSSATPAVVASRSFNTNAQLSEADESRDLDIDRRLGDRSVSRRRADNSPAFSDVLDPFVPRTVSQLLSMMDSMVGGSFPSATRGFDGIRRGWEAREDKDALYLRIDMPGLGKENVKVSIEQGTLIIKGEAREDKDALYLRIDMPGLGKENVKVSIEQGTLIIKGEGEVEEGNEGSSRRYSSRIDLPPELYKMDEIKAEMKNGVLKIAVPKLKEEERKDVYHININ
ncbi:hypothetical protein HPP92_005991 [Vanilla planifolia]|uniref:SHSP domain-containing protein n=1 Tax=Vanilla planifolia TaxID=51239 RepID=A0A835VCR8_VANPL|nr:hypothetical protein HPP92_005991 [Vanilla planifolia]